MTATVFEIKRFAVHDGDGIRTTAFFKGCPMRCVWCHNPEGLSRSSEVALYPHKCIGCNECKKNGFSASDCPGGARVLYGKEMTVDELLPLLLEDRDFYESSGGGVTLSGGECLMQADFCAELLKRLKQNGISTAVDTSGFVPREALDKVIPYTDVFLYDLKAYDSEVHERCTGVPNALVLGNLKYLDSLGAEVEIRIPYVPDYNSGEIEAIARFIGELHCVGKIRVLPYHSYAGSKYEALGIKNALPSRIPTEAEVEAARVLIEKITGIGVYR